MKEKINKKVTLIVLALFILTNYAQSQTDFFRGKQFGTPEEEGGKR
jgi:hypothetical protein